MYASSKRVQLYKYTSVNAIIVLILTCVIAAAIPVSAETPVLTVSGTDLAPSTIYIGETHSQENQKILMLKLTFSTTESVLINLTSITIRRTGASSDSDVEGTSLYKDTNANGVLDLGTDELLDTASFGLGKAEFSAPLTVTPEAPLVLLVSADISSNATSGGTLGVDIPFEDYIECEEYTNIEFTLGICSKNSAILQDTDGDLSPDIYDYDDDNDGFSDDIETRCGSDSKDADSQPTDTDSDGVPDAIDLDDDDDGVPDKYDDFPKDADKSNDLTIVYIYAAIAFIIIIVLVVLATRKPKRIDITEDLEDEDLNDLDIDEIHEEIIAGGEEEDLEEMDEEQLEDL